MKKTKLLIIGLCLLLLGAEKTNALTREEVAAIGEALTPSHLQEQPVQMEEPQFVVSPLLPDKRAKKQIEHEETAVEILYRLGLGQPRVQKKRMEDPIEYEHEARQLDRRIEILFGKGNNNG